MPGEIRNSTCSAQMFPQADLPADQLLQRANNLRITSGPTVLGVPAIAPLPACPRPSEPTVLSASVHRSGAKLRRDTLRIRSHSWLSSKFSVACCDAAS